MPDPSLTRPQLQQLARGCRLALWGLVVLALDLGLGYPGFKFDIINDAVGAGLLIAGVMAIQLAKTPQASTPLAWASAGAWAALIQALAGHLPDLQREVWLLSVPISLLAMAGQVALCVGMMRICAGQGWGDLAAAWKVCAAAVATTFGVGALILLAALGAQAAPPGGVVILVAIAAFGVAAFQVACFWRTAGRADRSTGMAAPGL